MRHGADLTVICDRGQIVREQACGQLIVAIFLQVLDDDPFERDRTTGMARGTIAKVDQQTSHARSDGPQTNDSNFGFLHACMVGGPCVERQGSRLAAVKTKRCLRDLFQSLAAEPLEVVVKLRELFVGEVFQVDHSVAGLGDGTK